MTEAELEQGVADNEQAGEELSDTLQFVTFSVGGEVFAIDMAPVQEIIRVPDVVRVPLAPPTLKGLSNLRGQVLPIISLRRIFHFDEQEQDDATRAVVIDIGQPLGFVVDRVASVLNVEPASLEEVDTIRGTVDSDLLTCILKDVGGFPMVMVLDFARLIEKEFAEIEALTKKTAMTGVLSEAPDEDVDEDSDELQLVSFTVEAQEYAIDISNVQEIVQIPENIVHVPNSPSHVLGLMNLRERLLPLVSLRGLFSLPVKELDEKSRIVVVALGTSAVGLITDSVSEVLRVPEQLVDNMPALMARDGDLSDIAEICRLDQGKRLVSILAVDNMFSHSMVKEALKTVDSMDESKLNETDDNEEDEDEEQVVVFHLESGEFGVPIESVQEIVRVPEELTHVPKAPDFVEGVINLRGAVLPVIDQRKRLALPAIDRNDRQRIMVFLISEVRIGFIVDAVTEVLKIPRALIECAPNLSGEQSRLLERIANLEEQQRMIQLIRPEYLVDQIDASALAKLGG